MRVTVHGPNLRDQSKGQFHVHAADCADNRRYGYGTALGGEPAWTFDAPSRRAIVLDIYDEAVDENGNTADDWRQYDDLWLAPCVKLPDEDA